MFLSFALSFLRFYLDFMKELHSSSEFCFNDETPGKISGVFSVADTERFQVNLEKETDDRSMKTKGEKHYVKWEKVRCQK